MMLTVTEREKVHEAAEIFVDEFLKQLSSRVGFSTNKYRGATAEAYGDYHTVMYLVDDDEE